MPQAVDEEEGDDDQPEDEDDRECPGRYWKINILTIISIDRYSQSNPENKVDHLEEDVRLDKSVVFCSDAVDLETCKHQIYQETKSTKPVGDLRVV